MKVTKCKHMKRFNTKKNKVICDYLKEDPDIMRSGGAEILLPHCTRCGEADIGYNGDDPICCFIKEK